MGQIPDKEKGFFLEGVGREYLYSLVDTLASNGSE